MGFYEQIIDGRTVISAQIEPQATRVTDYRDAECWLDAKQKLGYSLSYIQQYLLDKFFADRERAAVIA